MTPSEIAGRLMILGAKLEGRKEAQDAELVAEAAAWILFYLDKTTGNGAEAYNRTVTSSPLVTVVPMFNSVLKRDQ